MISTKKVKTVLGILKLEKTSAEDKVQRAIKLLPNKLNRQFAIWCARQCKIDCKEITNYIDETEKYYNRKATKKELRAANKAAYRAADRAANKATYKAAYWAAYKAANKATYKAAYWAAYKAAKEIQVKELINRIKAESEV